MFEMSTEIYFYYKRTWYTRSIVVNITRKKSVGFAKEILTSDIFRSSRQNIFDLSSIKKVLSDNILNFFGNNNISKDTLNESVLRFLKINLFLMSIILLLIVLKIF